MNRCRRATIYVAVLTTSMLVSAIIVGSLQLVMAKGRATQTLHDLVQARALAASALDAAVIAIEENDFWRNDYLDQDWVVNRSASAGTYGWRLDLGDPLPEHPGAQTVELLAVGRSGEAIRAYAWVGVLPVENDVNLIRAPEFNSDPRAWEFDVAGLLIGVANSETVALLVLGAPDQPAAASHRLVKPLRPGLEYALRLSVRSMTADNSRSQFQTYTDEVVDAAASKGSLVTGNLTGIPLAPSPAKLPVTAVQLQIDYQIGDTVRRQTILNSASVNSGDWTQVQGEFTVPADVIDAQARLRVVATTNYGDFLLGEPELVPVNPEASEVRPSWDRELLRRVPNPL